jgi:hypothetical protein
MVARKRILFDEFEDFAASTPFPTRWKRNGSFEAYTIGSLKFETPGLGWELKEGGLLQESAFVKNREHSVGPGSSRLWSRQFQNARTGPEAACRPNWRALYSPLVRQSRHFLF